MRFIFHKTFPKVSIMLLMVRAPLIKPLRSPVTTILQSYLHSITQVLCWKIVSTRKTIILTGVRRKGWPGFKNSRKSCKNDERSRKNHIRNKVGGRILEYYGIFQCHWWGRIIFGYLLGKQKFIHFCDNLYHLWHFLVLPSRKTILFQEVPPEKIFKLVPTPLK